jgi:alpha-mannosidase
MHAIAYSGLPVLEFRLRIQWNEARRRLVLSVPTAFRKGRLLGEVPAGAIERPGDGDVHVHGRWLVVLPVAGRDGRGALGARSRESGHGDAEKPNAPAIGLVGGGQHGLDFLDGEVRLSVLRGAAYCHERTFPIDEFPVRKFMDQGVHEVRLLVTAGEASEVRRIVPALADWLSAPPFALAHLAVAEGVPPSEEILALEPESVRLLACKRSEDGKALVLRIAECAGQAARARIALSAPRVEIRASLRPFEIRTIRVERSGRWREVDLVRER